MRLERERDMEANGGCKGGLNGKGNKNREREREKKKRRRKGGGGEERKGCTFPEAKVYLKKHLRIQWKERKTAELNSCRIHSHIFTFHLRKH